ncbi:hypothetical protein HF272_13685 [Rhizobium leguminosarum]|uniref:hypothetical protein n=1 Tax=Rhizobium leguminosarum TaxID=384 RepID=UPI001C929925|nr:hypothetical protein [Rhizobium leguminosarum]MBY2992481.1 hypothetical protein [Rhizobium leguminosarum]
MIVSLAEQATFPLLQYLTELYELDDAEVERLQLITGYEHSAATNEMAAFVRNVGRDRAQPHVVRQHLMLQKHLEPGQLTPAERLLIGTFVTTLCDLDDYERAFEAAREAAKPKPEAPPLPIEETTYRAVDEDGF